MPAPFPYKYDKAVPWGYEPTTIVNGVEKSLVNNIAVTNIAEASGLIRSGRVFTPVNLRGGKPVVKNPDNVRIEDLDEEKVGTSMASLKDAQQVVVSGQTLGWGKIVQLNDNNDRSGLGFNLYEQSAKAPRTIQEVKLISETFRSDGFMDRSCAILQDDADEGPGFVTRGGSSQRTPNWTSVDIPKSMHVFE
ncbi:hypothetical protein KIW84_012597 [Lathyrus oleraceus]|uniref:Uncharacterized protein n=1 Tax=Pisum sativum TaxID=3888 RepID=A0A9D5BI52_PEA|nr:hypothetical protein KIW84_012597 [Pisum sativum]